MRPINTALLRLAKRAETYDRQHLIDSFVDIGPLFTLLSNPDNQILFGRRGTGKTHVLGYLANEVQKRGSITIQLDMRTIGSTGGIYSDTRLTISERATRLLVDTLCAIHDQILTEVLEKAEEYDLSKLGPLLDRFVEAATDVVVQGTVEVEEMTSSTTADASTTKMDLGVSRDQVGSSLSVSNERASQREEASRRKREGTERLRVHFGAVGSAIDGVVSALPNSALWVILDEWSEIPLDLQPYLADLLRRTVLPIRGIT
jgi:hypothetical protein